MPFRAAVLVLASLFAGLSAACGPSIDLAKSLEVTDLFTGWYDFGVVNGQNKLVPQVSFRLKNTGTVPLNEVQLTVSFWVEGADGEWDAKEVPGIGREAVAPGGVSAPVLVRSAVGYTTEGARADVFTNPLYKDAVVKLFAKRGGRIVPLGEHKLERRIIPQAPTPAS